MALAFNWKAIYNDDSEFDQFDGETEHLFGDINMGELKELQLVGDGKVYKANIADGKLYEDDTELVSGCSGDLVYFRRNRVINVPTPSAENYVEFHLGIGNKKVIIKIDGSHVKEGFE